MIEGMFRCVAGVALLGMAAHAAAAVDGHWEGRIGIPGAPLDVRVDLEQEAEAWQGTIDIPAQGAEALPLFRIYPVLRSSSRTTRRSVFSSSSFAR